MSAIFWTIFNAIASHTNTSGGPKAGHMQPAGRVFEAPVTQTLVVEIRTLVAWLKSTLLLRIKWRDTHIYMQTECLQKKMRQGIVWGWEK